MNKDWTKNRRLLIHTYSQEDLDAKKFAARRNGTGILMVVMAILYVSFFMSSHAWPAEVINEPNIAGYSLNQWCKAIYIAEGGAKTAHPYGILTSYRHTTPLEACKNTVKHKYSDWVKKGRAGTFLAYLGGKFCPVGCSNDIGTNKNWIKNIDYWLKKG